MIWLWTSIVVFVVSLAFSLLSSPKEIFWNPDALYLPAVLIDVFRDGGSLKGWSFAPTPYFFPDLPFILFFGSLTGNVFWTLVIYSVFQVSLLAWALGRFIRSLEPKVPKTESYNLSLLTLSFLFLLSEKFPLLYYIYLPSMHVSAFLVTLWIWPYLRKERVKKYFIFPILVLATFSDRILIFELFLPAALAWARRYGRWGITFPLISVRFFASGVIGLGLYSLARVLLTITSPGKIGTIPSLSLWWNDLLSAFFHVELSGIFLVLGLISGFWCLAKSKEWGHSLAFAGYLQIILIFLPPLAGLYSNSNGLKLSLPAFLLVPVLLGIISSLKTPKKEGHARNIALFGIILGLGLLTAYQRGFDYDWNFTKVRKPNETMCIDELKNSESFVFVISEPEKARRIFTYSEKRVLAYPIDFSTLEGLHSISNREWFLFPPEGPIAVIPAGLGEHRIRSFYGEPSKIVTCPEGTGNVWIYEETGKILEFLQRPFQKTK